MSLGLNRFVFLVVGIAAIGTSSAFADVIQTRVFRVDTPAIAGDDLEVLTTRDGRVYFASPSDTRLVDQLKLFAGTRAPMNLTIDEDDRIVDVAFLSDSEEAAYTDVLEGADATDSESVEASNRAFPEYPATQLSTREDAQNLYNSLRMLNGGSQCYERAHVWAHQLENSRSIKSMKVFMFFTNTFRWRFTTRGFLGRTRPYKWWFHVAPFVYAGNEEIVLDRQFLKSAVDMESWTYHFVGEVYHTNPVPKPTHDEARCLDGDRYSQYSKQDGNGRYCVLLKVPMYYFQPLDVEALETRGQSMTAFRQGDLNRAYRNAGR